MARPKSTRTPEQLDAQAAAIDHEALAEAQGALVEQHQHIAEIEQQFGLGPYNKEGSVSRLLHLRQEIGSRLLEAGLLLIQMRAHEPPGEFYAALERAQIDDRFARRAMQVARKFGTDPLRRQLADQLGVGKTLALLTEDDDEIDALANGGEIAGHTADEFVKMTRREIVDLLKAEREERRADKDATAEVMREKDDRINTLLKSRRRIERSGPRAQADELLTQMDEFAVSAATAIKSLRDAASAIRATYEDAGEALDEEVSDRIDQNLSLAQQWAQGLAEELEV